MNYSKVCQDIYAAWLGKNIGIRLGAPVENWTYEDIKKTFGFIDRYVCDYEPCFAADDDSNGPAFFVRALDENPSKEITALEMGKQILNILSEGHGFFWWGGKGVATEHTAYLNLLEGINAPESGSAQVNGKDIAEQIGGQIFSDCWGYVAYDDPQLAADLSEKMASAMHDLDGIQGARYVAACISLGFKIKNAYEVVNKGLDYIDVSSSYYKLVKEMIDLYDKGISEEECLHYILSNHGYDKYPGVCHILPNTAIMVWSLLYGDNDFTKTMTILCSAGWDTDCTCGNVGSIIGAIAGVEGIDSYWITPIKDRFIGSSLIGSWNIDTLSRQAHMFTQYAFKLRNLSVEDNMMKASKHHYYFDLPYGIQGFECDSFRGFEASLIQKEHDLVCVIQNAFKDETLNIYKKTYYEPEDLYDVRYQPSFSPIVYPGETMKVSLDVIDGVEVRCYALGHTEKYTSEWCTDSELTLAIPAGEDVIHEAGIEVRALRRIMHEAIRIHRIDFDGQVDCRMDFRNEKMNDYGLDYGELRFKEISQCTTLKQKAYVDDQGLHIQDDMVIFGNADSSMDKMELDVQFEGTFEICFDVKGRLEYNSFVLTNDEIVFESHKKSKKGFTSKPKISKIKSDVIVHITFERCENTIKVVVNDECHSFEAEKSNGALGFRAGKDDSARITWCQFVMHEFS